MSSYTFLLSIITKSVFILANSTDPGETPHFAVSHLGLRCLYKFVSFSHVFSLFHKSVLWILD